MGVKKLPKVKELQTEYAKLLEEKKKIYAEYRRSREEMRELLTAKANVARVRKMEVEQDVEKDHGQLVLFKSVRRNAQPQNEILCSKGLVGAAPFYPKMKGAAGGNSQISLTLSIFYRADLHKGITLLCRLIGLIFMLIF